MIILVDMDGVLADFEKGFLNKWKQKHPDLPFVPLEQRTTFKPRDQYPKEYRPLVEEIYFSKTFYLDLPPIQGALEALSELSKQGNEVYICTTPLRKNPFCIPEKYDWIIKHLSKTWTERIISTKDKTIIRGDYLVDDNPKPIKLRDPTWKYILFSQPYNKNVSNQKRLDNWNNWRQVLK